MKATDTKPLQIWPKIILAVLTGLFVTDCSFTPSQLNANPTRYNGQIVVVRGFVKLAPEAHVLYDSRALDGEVQRAWKSGNGHVDVRKYAKYCVTIANPELLYENRAAINEKTITFQAKFINNYQIGKTVDLGACPFPTAIIINNAALTRRYPSLLPKK